MSGAEDRWAAAVAAWAQAQPDIAALVQIGSRVQPGAAPDGWSDFDYQLITSAPGRYRDGGFTRALGDCWAHGLEPAFGNVVKVTAVYEGALEADFVILSRAEVRVAALALRWPGTARWWPRRLVQGVNSLRRVAGAGWKVIKGGPAWERRYARLTYHEDELSRAEFAELCGQFWVQLVWAAKKARRGEFIASQRTIHRYLIEACLRVDEARAKAAGGPAFPLGRRAEAWLPPGQLAAARVATAPEERALFQALAQVADTFAGASAELAGLRRWPAPDYAEVRAWLRRVSPPGAG
jgi:hypothetical protein